jgi:6-phosphogluconolactonase (cycloisomerase 2 family)
MRCKPCMQGKPLYQVFCFVFCAIVFTFLTGCGAGSITANTQPTTTPTPSIAPTPTPTVSPSPTPTPTPAPASRLIFGITVFESNSGYQAGLISNGIVAPLPNDFTDSGLGQNIVTQLVADPQARFLYGLNLGASSFGITLGHPGIAEMQIIQQSGQLTRVPSSPLVFPSQQAGMLAIDNSGHFLYQPNAGVFDIYGINQITGLLTKLSSSAAGSVGFFTVISPDGRFLFNSGNPINGNQVVESLSIASDGTLAVVQSPIPTGGASAGVAGQLVVSSDNRFLFVLNQGSIAIFNIGGTGMLSPVVGSPFATDAGGAGFAIAPDGRHLYVAFQPNTNFVRGFTFDPVASTLTPIAGAFLNNDDRTITLDGSGSFAYVTEAGLLVTYSVDPATGALTRVSQATKPTSEGEQSMVVVP